MKFQILSWVPEDDEVYNIHLFGKTEDNLSVCLTVEYQPFLYIENSPGMSTIIEEHKSYTRAIKSTKVKKEKFYGYNNYKEYNFYKLYYSTQREWKNAQYYFEKKKITLYEANVDPLLKFLHDSDIETAGWVEVINYTKYPHTDMKVDIHIETNNYKNVKKLEKDDVAPFVIASFDIECYSPDNSFPDPENIDCPVIQIATTFYKVGDQNYFKKVLLTLDTCDPIEDVEVYSYENEKDLLEKWTEIIHENKTDCYLGYNIWGFDFWYMYKRATMVGAEDFLQLGKTEKEAELKFTNFSSSAYGYSDYKMVSSPGIFQLDLLVVMKRDYKLTSYSLNNVSAHFLGDQKEDLSPKEMFAKQRGSSKDRRDIGTYCVKDTYLPLKLIQKLAIFTNMIEMAKITLVPISFLIERGQGIKVFSQLCYETKQQNMLIETFTYKKRSKNPEDSDYEGATVLNAKKGSYMEEPITGLDFASLYPSIMRAHNLCVSTLVFHPSMRNLEGETYDIIDGYPFAQNRKGVIPRMLEKLALARKDAKKAMNNAKSDFMKMVYNGKQLAYKVSMNSIYGACGSPTFQVPCKIVAACTTSKGREMIEQTKNMVEKNYPGSEVVYGDTDSVMVKFPTKSIEESFKLGEEAADMITKTFKHPIELEMEKVYNPYLLWAKKRYAGLMYTKPEKPDYIDAKGIQLVRRDNCPLVRKISKEILNIIMYEKDIEKAKKITQEYIRKLENNEIPIDDLVVSKSLKRIKYTYDKNSELKVEHDYANPQPHVQVAENIERREKGTGPKSGERVPYVFINTGNPKDLQYMKAEHPDFVQKNNIELDIEYYKERSLLSPVESLFELFYENPKKEIFDAYEKAKQADVFNF